MQTTMTFDGQCISVVVRNAQEIWYHLEWMKFDFQEGYAALKSSNERETLVWCFLFLVWLTIYYSFTSSSFNLSFFNIFRICDEAGISCLRH